MQKKLNIIITVVFMFALTLISQEEKSDTENKPNIYDLIVIGKFRDAEKICPEGNLKDSLNEILSINAKASQTYEKDIGKELTLTVRGLPMTGKLEKIKGTTLFMKLKRGKGSVLMPVKISSTPIDDRMNRAHLSELAKKVCLGAKFFRQKNYQAAEIILKSTGNLSEGFLEALVRKSNYFMELLLACNREDIEKIDEIIKKGGNVNSKFSAMIMDPKTKKYKLQTSTLLIEIIKKRKTKSVKHLVKSGADVNSQNSDGVTPLMFSLSYYPDDTEVMEFLIENKAKIQHKDIKGNSPLSGAIAMERKDAVKLLLEKGANPNDATSKGYTPVMIAVMANQLEILKMLLNAGADIHKPHPKGWTVFQLDKRQISPEINAILEKLKPEKKKEKISFPGGINVKRR